MNVEKIVQWFESGRVEKVMDWLFWGWNLLIFFVIGSGLVAMLVR